MHTIERGLHIVSATTESLNLVMAANHDRIVHLDRSEMDKLLDEVADVAPHRLHEALERRMLRLIQRQVALAVEAAGVPPD